MIITLIITSGLLQFFRIRKLLFTVSSFSTIKTSLTSSISIIVNCTVYFRKSFSVLSRNLGCLFCLFRLPTIFEITKNLLCSFIFSRILSDLCSDIAFVLAVTSHPRFCRLNTALNFLSKIFKDFHI